MARLLRSFYVTALFVAILGTLAGVNANLHNPSALDGAMFLTIYPAMLAGFITYFWKPRRK